MTTRFDRINDVKTPRKPRKNVVEPPRLPEDPPLPAVVLTAEPFMEKVESRRYDPATYIKWPGHKPKDPDIMREKKRYRDLEQKLLSQFKKDLIAEFRLTDHPKADLCYDLAWSEGHASGLHEVVMYFERFSELIRP